MPEIEYFYSAHSAFAYLGSARLMEIAAAAGRRIVHRPMDLNAVVGAASATGFAERSRAHRAYYFGREIERWAEFRGVSFKGGIPANHRNDTTLANCMLIACARRGHDAGPLAHAMLEAHWLAHGDLADETVLARCAQTAGLDAAALLRDARTADVEAAYRANTAEAIERSVFGSPTYWVDGDMFYGQDRLELVERALRQPFARTWPATQAKRHSA